VGVAVVDTGVDLSHADLGNVRNAFTAFGTSAQDNNGHGTHVAGIIAALNNTIDVVGVAPDAAIYAVKVLDASGSGSDAAVTAGLDWVYANATSVHPAIRVVNMSLGRAGTIDDNSLMRTAITKLRDSGITVVVAAGNDATLEITQQVPAAYPEVLAVSSTTAKDGTNQYRFFNGVIKADTASYFTSDGAGVTISAPGEDQTNVTKAGFLQSVGILSTKLGGGTTRMSGTSMAAPHVAGVAALIYQKSPTIAPEIVRNLIRGSASNTSAPLDSPTSNYSFDGTREGVLDAKEALNF
jgi:subtilisin